MTDCDKPWGLTYEEVAEGRNLEASYIWVTLFKEGLENLASQLGKVVNDFLKSVAEAARDINLEAIKDGRKTRTDEDKDGSQQNET